MTRFQLEPSTLSVGLLSQRGAMKQGHDGALMELLFTVELSSSETGALNSLTGLNPNHKTSNRFVWLKGLGIIIIKKKKLHGFNKYANYITVNNYINYITYYEIRHCVRKSFYSEGHSGL